MRLEIFFAPNTYMYLFHEVHKLHEKKMKIQNTKGRPCNMITLYPHECNELVIKAIDIQQRGS